VRCFPGGAVIRLDPLKKLAVRQHVFHVLQATADLDNVLCRPADQCLDGGGVLLNQLAFGQLNLGVIERHDS
jgi:hypothetical protein